MASFCHVNCTCVLLLLDSLMEQLSTEHAQLQQSGQVAMETVQQERDDLQHRLQQQVL